VINTTTKTTVVSSAELDNDIWVRLLKEEWFESAPKTWKCRYRNNFIGQSIPDPRSRDIEGPTADRGQSESRHYEATGAGRAGFPPTALICDSVERSKVPWRGAMQVP